MIGTSGMHYGPRRHRGAARIMPSINTSRKPYRKGTVFITVSGLVLISGTIMTILGFTNVFGAGITMLGMLMIAVSVLLLLFATRQFVIAKKLQKAERTLQITHGTVAAMVIEREDEMVGTFTVVMDAVNIETRSGRSNEDCLPPDYTEATSDFYPESSVDMEDPPPPYGPPTYDETMSNKVKLSDDGEGENSEEHHEQYNEEERMEGGESSHNDTTSQPSSLENRQTLPQGTSSQHISIGYQDLPTVTI